MDDIDCLLNGEESCLRVCRRSHIHQALAEFIRCNRIIRNKQKISAYNAAPLCRHLTVNQTIVDPCQSNIWHVLIPLSLGI